MADANSAYTLADADASETTRRIQPDDDRAAAGARRHHRSRHLAGAARNADLPRRMHPHARITPSKPSHCSACRIINIKLGRVGGFHAAKQSPRCRARARHSGVVRRHARIRHRPRAQHRAFDAAQISFCPATSPPASATGPATSSRRPSKSRAQGTITVPTGPGLRL